MSADEDEVITVIKAETYIYTVESFKFSWINVMSCNKLWEKMNGIKNPQLASNAVSVRQMRAVRQMLALMIPLLRTRKMNKVNF